MVVYHRAVVPGLSLRENVIRSVRNSASEPISDPSRGNRHPDGRVDEHVLGGVS